MIITGNKLDKQLGLLARQPRSLQRELIRANLKELQAQYESSVYLRMPDGLPGCGGQQVTLAFANSLRTYGNLAGLVTRKVMRGIIAAAERASKTKVEL